MMISDFQGGTDKGFAYDQKWSNDLGVNKEFAYDGKGPDNNTQRNCQRG